MDGQQGNAPEQYFATADGAPEVPHPHTAAMAAGSGSSRDVTLPLSPYAPLASDAQTQPQPAFHLADTSSHPALAGAAPPYGFGPVAGTAATGFQTGPGWQQAGQHLPYTNTAPTAVQTNASLNAFGYMPYNERQQGSHTEDHPLRFDRNYVVPTNTAPPMGYAYNWNAMDATNLEYDSAPFYPPTERGSPSASPMEAGTGTGTPTSLASSSSSGPYPAMYTGAANIHAQVAAAMGSRSSFAGGEGERESPPVAKRAKKRPNPPPAHRASFNAAAASTLAPTVPGSSSEGSRPAPSPSSRRGPRASSHTPQQPAERTEDKKTRGSHNLVEKQYRNRLNAQFQGLMNALPEDLKSQGSGARESNEAAAADAADRRPSKAEVLEIARRHIQSLEQERDTLVRERDELRGSMQRLQEIYASQAVGQDRLNERWPGEGGDGLGDNDEN